MVFKVAFVQEVTLKACTALICAHDCLTVCVCVFMCTCVYMRACIQVVVYGHACVCKTLNNHSLKPS